MSKTFIMTIVGPYSLGIIKALAHTTHELDGNWKTSKVIKLDGHFTALVKVEIDEKNVETLKANFASEFAQLHFLYDELIELAETEMKELVIEFDCVDRPGIIRDIHELLANFDLHVEGMESHRYEVFAAGKSVFSAKLVLKIAQDINADELVEELSSLVEDARIHIV